MESKNILLLFVAACLALGIAIGYYLGYTRGFKNASEIMIPEVTVPPATPHEEHEEGVYCTMDAKICPDGTAVGRIPPACEFAPCPSM